MNAYLFENWSRINRLREGDSNNLQQNNGNEFIEVCKQMHELVNKTLADPTKLTEKGLNTFLNGIKNNEQLKALESQVGVTFDEFLKEAQNFVQISRQAKQEMKTNQAGSNPIVQDANGTTSQSGATQQQGQADLSGIAQALGKTVDELNQLMSSNGLKIVSA